MLKKILKGLLVVVVVVLAAAALWYFLPDNLVTNGPLFDFMTGRQLETPTEQKISSRFNLPDGFRIGVFATKVPHARMMRLTSEGEIVVASMREGNIILLHADADGDGLSDGRTNLLADLDSPNGLAIKDGYLYVAEMTRIIRAPFDAEARTVGEVETILDGMPDGGHFTRTVGFGPEGWLYVTVGSSCNACIEEHPYRAAMLRMRPDGSDVTVYATGLRNTVGFDWQPGTNRLYGTDNGRDLLGDDIPQCELNLIEEGQSYGWPYTFDNKAVDPDYGAGNEDKIAMSRVMAAGLGAHVAPLGIKFFNSDHTPAGYEGAALIALHGSWNRSVLSGYKVVSAHFGEDGAVEIKDFLTGFEKDEDVIGRPVDMVQGADGAIYISDDYAGTIFRIGWGDLQVSSTETSVADKVADPFAGLGAAEIATLSVQGAVLYEENSCASCHDPAMAAEGVQVKLLDDLRARFDVDGIVGLLKAPPAAMPTPEISDEQRKALAVYLLSK